MIEDNPEAARRVAQTIVNGCDGLKKFPYLGRLSVRMAGRRELVFPPLPRRRDQLHFPRGAGLGVAPMFPPAARSPGRDIGVHRSMRMSSQCEGGNIAISLATRARISTARSSWAFVCVAVTMVRTRALP